MGLAALQNYPETPSDFAEWAHSHAAHHADILRRIQELYGQNLSQFVLDPMDPDDVVSWSANHRIMHDEMDQVLGIQGSDLTGLNWRDRPATSTWLLRNFVEHEIAGRILGV